MRKTNSYLWIFLGIFVVLTALSYNACSKYIPFFLHNTVYYCRQLLQSVSPQPLQLNLKTFTLWGLVVLAFYIAIRILLTAYRIFEQHKLLEQKVTGDDDILQIIEKLDLHNKVRVIEDRRMGAFCFGVTSPKIYISTQMIAVATADEIEAVLRHEKYHLENNDTLVMLFAVFTESLFPFFPLITDFISHYQTNRELQADKSAISAMAQGKDHLRSILTKLLRHDIYPAYITAPSFADARTLETRIRTLVKETPIPPNLSVKNVLVSILSVTILGGLVMAPVQAIEYHYSGEDAVMACINSNGNCTNACQQNNTAPESSSESSRPYSPVIFTSLSY